MHSVVRSFSRPASHSLKVIGSRTAATISLPGTTPGRFNDEPATSSIPSEEIHVEEPAPSSSAGSSNHPYASTFASSSSSSSPPPPFSTEVPHFSTDSQLPSLPAMRTSSSTRQTHPFDTHSIYNHLEKAGFEPGLARTLMEGTRGLILARNGKAKEELLSKQDSENSDYLFQAALSELRTLLDLRKRNESLQLNAFTSKVEREIDDANQRLKEGMEGLKHDIAIETSNRKSEVRMEHKAYELAIVSLDNKFTIQIGDMRPQIERNKVILFRKSVYFIGMFFVSFTLFDLLFPPSNPAKPKKGAKASTTPVVGPTVSAIMDGNYSIQGGTGFSEEESQGGRVVLGGFESH